MANRHAPYKARYLSREPKTLVVKFTSNGTTGAQTLSNGNATTTGPFNQGVVSVTGSATGIYKISLGETTSQLDQYTHLAGIDFVANESDRILDYVTNVECNHATDPNITIQVSDTDALNAYVSNTKIALVRLHFLDSSD